MTSKALLLAALIAAPAANLAALAPAAAQVQSQAKQQLDALFRQSDEDNLRRNPLSALFRGDMRYAAVFGDYISDEYYAKEKAADEAELRRLLAIDRSALSPTDRIAYDVFRRGKEQSLKGFDPAIMATTIVRPIDHFSGLHTAFPDLSSGQGAAPFKTV